MQFSSLSRKEPWTVWVTTNWKMLKETPTPKYLICCLRNLYAGEEATVRTGHGTTDWFWIGKGVHQGCILLPYLFNLYAEHIMQNAVLDKHKLESELPGKISVTSDLQMTLPYGRKRRGTKEPLDGEWKIWLKIQHSKNEDHGIWSHLFMANRWGNNENSERLYFLGLQNHCRWWWLQPWKWKTFAPWKKSYDQPRQHIKKQTFANKGPSSQRYDFPSSHVWKWELDYREGWALNNWLLLNCDAGEDSWGSLGLHGDQTSQS